MGNAANLIVSPALLYISPVGTTLPNETTVAAGASWGAGWTDVGFTSSPLVMNMNDEKFALEVEQVSAELMEVLTKRVIELETTLAEITAANLKYAMSAGSTIVPTAAGAGQHGFEKLAFGGEVLLPEYQVGFEASKLDSSGNALVTRFFFYRCTLSMDGSLEFSKKAQAGIPLKIKAMPDTTKSQGSMTGEMQRVTAWKLPEE